MDSIIDSTAPEICMHIGNGLKILRLNRNMTQQQVAEICQCNKKTITKIEAGSPRVAMLYIARYVEAVKWVKFIEGIADVIPFPTVIGTTAKYPKRSRPRKNKNP